MTELTNELSCKCSSNPRKERLMDIGMFTTVVSVCVTLLYALAIKLSHFDKTEHLSAFECYFYSPCSDLNKWNSEAANIIQAKKMADDFSDKHKSIRVIYDYNYGVHVIKEYKTNQIVSKYVDNSPIYESKYDSKFINCKEKQSHTVCMQTFIANFE